ncbi:MAG: L,D-transpeptidase family protein [Prevotella sp.]|nr:L,D-transpeptidase family protein [Prevotella sp.]
MRRNLLALSLLFVVSCLIACHEKGDDSRQNITMATWGVLHDEALTSDESVIRQLIDSLSNHDKDTLVADYQVRKYYKGRNPFLWITAENIYPQLVDTFLVSLESVARSGFSPSKFMADQLRSDLSHLDSLQFDDSRYNINKVLARLEYNLTKGYLRLVVGERYGYMNPEYILNRLDRDDKYPGKIVYRRIFDTPIEHPDSSFYAQAIHAAATDSMLFFIESCRPQSPLFAKYQQRLATTTDQSDRLRLLCNMERSRWRQLDSPENHRKRVVVNIPSFRVWAYDRDTTISMKIACGANRTKTPLLASHIKRIEMNPLWIIPRSIIEKEVMAHVGDSAYFARNHYFIRNRQTGDTIQPQHLTPEILKNTNYMVAQERGAGNSLGRIIFRFDNDFAVYLHDTNSPGVFGRDNRAVSHGCVRLERPLDMAFFLLADKNPQTMEKIRYSTKVDLRSADADSSIDKSKMLSSLPLKPEIPVFITYYTIFPDADGTLRTYPDVYGYDRVISRYLKNYME